MRVLLDTCVWGGTKASLSLSGHDVIWGGDWESDPGDAEILSLVTCDGNRIRVRPPENQLTS